MRIQAKEIGDWIQIEISDNGVGIRADLREKVFDMFFRGHELSQGTGLGLYIVRNTIEKLGGKIALKSEENKGTTFTIILPNNNGLFSEQSEGPDNITSDHNLNIRSLKDFTSLS